MRFSTLVVLIHLCGTIVLAQTSATTMSDGDVLAGLQRIAAGEWHPQPDEPLWQSFKHRLSDELLRRPDGPLAAEVRRTAADIEVQASPHLVSLSPDDMYLSVSARPRYLLDRPIPYVVTVFASADDGEWFRLGQFAGDGCGAKASDVWPRPLRDGLHHLALTSEITFLRESRDTAEGSGCRFFKRGATSPALQANDSVIQTERRAIPGLSFAISPDMLGGPTVMAASPEAGLPGTALQRWLDSVLAGVRQPTSIKESWIPEFCRAEEAAAATAYGWQLFDQPARRKPRDLCVNFLVSFDDGRLLELRLRAGKVNQDTGEWSLETLTFLDLSIGADGKVVDVPFLSMLRDALGISPETYPEKDVSIDPWDIRIDPMDAKPGELVNIRATIRNLGGHDAPLTPGTLMIKGCCDEPPVVHDFLADIPAGGSQVVSYQAIMPHSGWIAVHIVPISVGLRQGPYGQFREENLLNNATVIEVGQRTAGVVPP